MRLITTLLLVLATSMAGVPVVHAQVTTAAVNGTVRSDKGEVITGATIRLRHTPSGTVYGATSRKDGRYMVTGLRIGGPYAMTVTSVGMKTAEYTIQNLALGETRKFDVAMQEGVVEGAALNVVALNSIESNNI